MCIYIHVYIYIHIHIYMYFNVCIYIYIHNIYIHNMYTQYHTPITPPGGRGTVLWLADPWPWRGGRSLERWTVYTYIYIYTSRWYARNIQKLCQNNCQGEDHLKKVFFGGGMRGYSTPYCWLHQPYIIILTYINYLHYHYIIILTIIILSY